MATHTFPTNIFMTREWPQLMLPSVVVIFFDSAGCQFLSVQDVYISKRHRSGHPYVFPSQYHAGELHFGTMEHRTTTPPTRLTTTLCRRIASNILLGINIQVYHFQRPPRVMQALSLDAAIWRPILIVVREEHEPTTYSGTYNCYIFGYIDSC